MPQTAPRLPKGSRSSGVGQAVVIHPPVRVEYFNQPGLRPPTRDYVLGVGRWIPYKNLHLVVECAAAAGIPVKIAGGGPDKSRIVAAAAAARVPVEIIESPTNARLRSLPQCCLPCFPDGGGFRHRPGRSPGRRHAGGRGGGRRRDGHRARWPVWLSRLRARRKRAGRSNRSSDGDSSGALRVASASRFTREIFTQRIRDWVSVEAS